jgi:hypothetical protein
LLVTRLAESLKVKSLKVRVLGNELELTVEQGKVAFDEMLQEMLETTNELTTEDVALFHQFDVADGRHNVIQLVPRL